MSVDVELDSNIVTSDNSEINSEIDIEMSTNQEIEVYIEPREYKVVGDDVYIPINFDSAPTWLTQAITDLTNIKVTDVVTNLDSMINDLTYAVQQIEVAKNQYEQSITSLNDIDSRFNSLLTTLNSNMDGLDASLKDLIATKVTSTQASVVALNAITTAMNDTSTGSTLCSAILNLQTSITNLNNSTNTSLTSLESSINGAVDANAQAVEVINTYVGIDDAGASTGTGLSAYLEDSTGNIGGADSSVANSVYVDSLGNTRSKFEYNSNISYNGYNYQSGFGIVTNLTSSSIPVGQSEFWINASKFKFTNSNQTGQVAPFTIDASGANPQIKFNGVVNFSNITNVPQLGSTPQEVVTAINNTQTTTINGPRITTGSVTAAQIQAGSVSADRLTSTNGSSTVWAGGGLISANFNGNVVGNIGNPTAGFRLSSNAAGTLGSNDPNIYGAYILGSIIDASSSFITSSYLDSSKTGSAIATKVNPILYGANYSSGFLSTRFTKTSSYAVVSAHGRQYIQEDRPSTTYLEYTINDGATWEVLDSVYNSSSGGKLETRVTLTGVVISSSVPTTGYMQFRTRYIVNGSTSFTNVTIIATVYNI